MDGAVNERAILKTARTRLAESIDADRDNRDDALDDLESLAGRQWPQELKDERESDNRVVVTINRLPQFSRQVTGDLRRMNPAIKVMAGDEGATEDVATVYEGIIRDVEYRCSATKIYEGAAEGAAQCGMGYWRIRTDYESKESFNKRILLERIHNPFSVYLDPAARESTRSDAGWGFITEQMSLDDFRQQHPGKTTSPVDADDETDNLEHWRNKGDIIVAEYFWKEPFKYTIGQLASGEVVKDPTAAHDIVRKREVDDHKVMWAKISGAEVLEGPTEFPCEYIPIVAVVGEELHVGDEVVRSSVIRHAKDPQRLYNYWRSAQTEMVALQPKAPFLVTAKQIEGVEALWDAANDSNAAYLPYNADPKAPGPPQRAAPPVPSAGMMQEVMSASEDMKATTGIYDAGLGNSGNEKSGVAIRQRQMEGDIANSIYSDNLAASIEHTGRILVGMIPRVYDTHRKVRTVSEDGGERMVEVNGVKRSLDGVHLINPLKKGSYGVKVTVGPSYTTLRQETAESLMQFVGAVPGVASVAGDLIAENMDWKGADKLARRLRKMLPPGVIDPENMSPQEQQEFQQRMKAAEAQQQQQAEIERQIMQTGMMKEQAEAQEAQADAQGAQLDVQEKALELAIKGGQLDAIIAQQVNAAVMRALQGAFQPQI